MDITLKRIVEELKLNKIKKTDLTNYLGFSSSAIFGHWISGRNTSYLKYLHAIASYLDVSVEYLKGETDIKKPPSENGERFDELYSMVEGLNETEITMLKAFVAGLKANRKPD
jgi:hypothetical protein